MFPDFAVEEKTAYILGILGSEEWESSTFVKE